MSDKVVKRLVVVPSDPIDVYEKKGRGEELERYYNPTGMFNEVYALSPLEKGEYKAYGMTIRGVNNREFRSLIREIKPQVVRAYGGYWPSDFVCRNRIPGIPVVVSVHDTNPKMIHRSIRYADLVICMSKVVAEKVMKIGVQPERIRILPNRVDTSIFRPVSEPARLEKINGQFPSGKHILHIGRLTAQKNLDTLIRALQLLPKEYSCICVSLGDKTLYLALAEKIGVRDRCFWIDSIKNSELALWYSWCDCFCVPSRWEGFGIVFIEAAACGATIVTSDIAPMNEYLTDGVSACLVRDYENPSFLAQAIRKACEDKEYRNRIVAGGMDAIKPFERNLVDKIEAVIYSDAIQIKGTVSSGQMEMALWKIGWDITSAVRFISPKRLAGVFKRALCS